MRVKYLGDEVIVTNGMNKITITPADDKETVSIVFGQDSKLGKFSLSARFYNPYYIEKLNNKEINFKEAIYADYLNDNYTSLSLAKIRRLCRKAFSIDYNHEFEDFISFDISVALGEANMFATFRVTQSDGEYGFHGNIKCFLEPVHGHTFELDKNAAEVPIDSLNLEDLIYNHAIDCYYSLCDEPWFNQWGIEYNDIFYPVPYKLTHRLCWNDNLRKLDFVNTGNVINLSNEEIKKYEGHLAKCEMFGNENTAELFIKKDGTCMMIY